MKIAVLDVDGTLFPGALAQAMPAKLVAAGLSPPDRLARLRACGARIPGCEQESVAVAERMSSLFAAMLTDVVCRRVAHVAEQVWEKERGRVFPFARLLVAALRDAGYVPMLISSGPQMLVAHLAAELGVALYRGVRFVAEDGLYTGRTAPGMPGAKVSAAMELAGGDPIDWPASMAMGNTLGDLALLQRAGHRVAFEPSPALLAHPDVGEWTVCDRHDVAATLRERMSLDLPPVPGRASNHAGGPARPVTAVPPAELTSAIRRLREHVLRQMDRRSVVVGRCASRVCESALMLTLTRREKLEPRTQQALRAYLERARADAGDYDRAVIDATLHGVPARDPERLAEHACEGAGQPCSARNKLALVSVLALVGPEPFSVRADSDAFEHHGQVAWTALRLMAIHLLNTADPVPAELTERLLNRTEQGQRHGVWEKFAFSHLFALLALNRVLPGHPVIRQGVRHLAACQNPDGGMPMIASEEVFATVTAGLALARAGVPARILTAMGDYLAAQQRPDGGWAYAEGVRTTDTDSTTHVLRFLHDVDPAAYQQAIGRARRNLSTLQDPSGGFPTYLPGQPCEVTMTANAVAALAPYAWAHRPALDRATGYLLAAQRPDGTFERSWSLSEANAMSHTMHALHTAYRRNPGTHAGRVLPAIAAARRRLWTTANPDGGWGQIPGRPSDPISTAYTLFALGPADHRGGIDRGIRYLLDRQDTDGGYTSITDQAAPRPLPYDIPVLADHYVLLALAHLQANRPPPD
ncbi:haloacid dehalogenase-like hydrolase [Nonomuraea sp. NPDC049714]|uniref:haloacid dehalogenase-like hydrolase n=1 Tax=Nonomuraea sp. NPDC049714 TaxID=3364357 RepID=UPI0037B1C4FB